MPANSYRAGKLIYVCGGILTAAVLRAETANAVPRETIRVGTLNGASLSISNKSDITFAACDFGWFANRREDCVANHLSAVLAGS